MRLVHLAHEPERRGTGLEPVAVFGRGLQTVRLLDDGRDGFQTHPTPCIMVRAGEFAKTALAAFALILLSGNLVAQTGTSPFASKATNAVLLEMEGPVESLRKGARAWDRSYTNQVLYPEDELRTGRRSRATLRLSDLTPVRLGELSHLRMPSEPKTGRTFNLLRGLFYFLHRDQPGEYDLRTPTVSAVVRGTEFNLRVADDGTTTLTLFDGSVEMSNELGHLTLRSGEQAIAEPGKQPAKTAVLTSALSDVIQWSLYYPGVLDLRDLELSDSERQALHASLTAYQSGDLLQAMALYPADRKPQSDSEKIFLAALLLAVGQVEETDALLRSLTPDGDRTLNPISNEASRVARLADALRSVIASVKFQAHPLAPDRATSASLATELLAESYYHQSRSNLQLALDSAEAALKASPEFGFAWARVAELEFSFGRIPQAQEPLSKSLKLSPRNAEALSLQGFVLAARNRTREALDHFQKAIATDGALANAWLGRGLIRIRQGEMEAGRSDLAMAAILEPHRSLLRSYLAKAFSQENLPSLAFQELELAKKLDPHDPTAWLYSALIRREQNQINAAVRDLERSKDLNENRSLFRSRLLLDQDQAVRGANLAAIYRDAGMVDVSLREASRAVDSDYGNYSAHLFLANSYAALRDPRQVSLRYETPWFNELLLANLLSPVGSGPLSQNISQQEYSKLFERERIGLSSLTEYSSRGDWLQSGSQYGIFGHSSYALDAVYLSQNGQRPNEDISQLTTYAKFKQQLTPQDSVFFQAIYYDNKSGDVRQYYDPRAANPDLRFTERQEPTVFAGYHREWAPGSHTLFLAGRLDDRVTLKDPNARILTVQRSGDDSISRARDLDFDQRYRSELEAYSTELQHILQRGKHTLIVGGRFQTGGIDTRSETRRPPTAFPPDLLDGPIIQANSTDLERASFYGYDQWQVFEPFRVTAGLSYDRLVFPRNVDAPPISGDESAKDQLSPKAGFIWTLAKDTHLRGAYTRSLGGVYYDSSVRLEPSQISGFTQAFRSLIPESVMGSVAGSRFETWGIALDHKFGAGTYAGLEAEILDSRSDRWRGVFDYKARPAIPAATPEKLDYRERALTLSVNQLIANHWAAGARYRVSEADLSSRLPGIPLAAFSGASADLSGVLHELQLYLVFSHSSGFFAQADSVWNAQKNGGYDPVQPGDDFWQFNGLAGYRFLRRKAEFALGIMNISDQDYRLNPLNLHSELPRDRTFLVRLKFDL